MDDDAGHGLGTGIDVAYGRPRTRDVVKEVATVRGRLSLDALVARRRRHTLRPRELCVLHHPIILSSIIIILCVLCGTGIDVA